MSTQAPKDAPSPIRPTDDEARALAQSLMREARLGALGVIHPGTGAPHVTRIALSFLDGAPVTLISSLALHYGALEAAPECSLLLGDIPSKGDPLAFARLSLAARAEFVARESATHAPLREAWLADHPKAKLYVDFADFSFVRFSPLGAALNGGFGKAYDLTAADLTSR